LVKAYDGNNSIYVFAGDFLVRALASPWLMAMKLPKAMIEMPAIAIKSSATLYTRVAKLAATSYYQ
jgi:hypothetical protein